MQTLDTSLQNKTVLFVEDSPVLRRFFELSLAKTGAKVIIVDTIKAAREIISSRPLDVAILDVELPDGVGTDLREPLIRLGVASAFYTGGSKRDTLRSLDIDVWSKENVAGLGLVTRIVELLHAHESKKTGGDR